MAAALLAGTRRLITQSISYAPGKQPYAENAPLNRLDDPRWSRTVLEPAFRMSRWYFPAPENSSTISTSEHLFIPALWGEPRVAVSSLTEGRF